MKINMKERVIVLDFGGRYKEHIAAMVRELSVYSEVHPGNTTAAELRRLNPKGIILTGGHNSVYSHTAVSCDPELFNLGVPILGICYGMQLICHMLGGKVAPEGRGEYGPVLVNSANSALSEDKAFLALMRHSDSVIEPPKGFDITVHTDLFIAAFENPERKLYGVQFHPETKHTDSGKEIMRSFLYKICGVKGDYKLDDYIDAQISQIRQKVGNNRVLLGLSGGVDSSVCASLLSKAVRKKLVCIFVDHGLMRLDEGDEIEQLFSLSSKMNLEFIRVNAEERFLTSLKGVTDPEKKRKIIGEEFIRVFEEQASLVCSANVSDVFLAQGTIYPDIIESGGAENNPSATIKSHHNVGGLPDNLAFSGVIEPLAGLFKDEVRMIGKKMGLPLPLINRQPFPGPGLAVRIMGEVTKEKLDILRACDAILRDELDGLRNRDKPSQYFAVLTDTFSVGIKGDNRTYNRVVAIRAVTTDDFMTCEYTRLTHRILSHISSRITSEVAAVSRVVYDITNKPPGTIEWE